MYQIKLSFLFCAMTAGGHIHGNLRSPYNKMVIMSHCHGIRSRRCWNSSRLRAVSTICNASQSAQKWSDYSPDVPAQASRRSRREALGYALTLTAMTTLAPALCPNLPTFRGQVISRLTASAAEEPSPQAVNVGPGEVFVTISAALDAVPPGTVISIAPGRYSERLVLRASVTLQPAPGSKGGEVVVVWETSEPYQAVLEGGPTAGGALVCGLTLRHRSPSVANNYAVFLQGCGVTLKDCDVSSSSGSGVGIEGGAPKLISCAVHDCVRHGVAIFGDALGGDEGSGGFDMKVEDCTIKGNKLNGLLIRDGASPQVLRNTVTNNSAFGIVLQDCAGLFKGNVISGNRKGSVAIGDLAEIDGTALVQQNQLDSLPSRMEYR